MCVCVCVCLRSYKLVLLVEDAVLNQLLLWFLQLDAVVLQEYYAQLVVMEEECRTEEQT